MTLRVRTCKRERQSTLGHALQVQLKAVWRQIGVDKTTKVFESALHSSQFVKKDLVKINLIPSEGPCQFITVTVDSSPAEESQNKIAGYPHQTNKVEQSCTNRKIYPFNSTGSDSTRWQAESKYNSTAACPTVFLTASFCSFLYSLRIFDSEQTWGPFKTLLPQFPVLTMFFDIWLSRQFLMCLAFLSIFKEGRQIPPKFNLNLHPSELKPLPGSCQT